MLLKKMTAICCLLLASGLAFSQTANEIIDHYISFIGGAKAWHKITTLTISGTYNYGGIEFPFSSYSKSPDHYKYIVSFKGKSFSQAFDGEQGWRIDGFKNEKEKTILTGPNAKAMANETDVELESPLINYKMKGHTVRLDGPDTLDQKPCYRIKFIRKDGDTSTLYFDRHNYALLMKQAVSKNAELDKVVLNIKYEDYQIAEGIRIPFKTTCTSNGQVILIIKINSVRKNLDVNDSIFKP